MAYRCVLAPSQECDGCQECEENKTQYDPRWDCEYDRDEELIRYIEREERSNDR